MTESTITHTATWAGRQIMVTWLPATFIPPRDAITQASGICFTEHRKIVLVSGNGQHWNLPGGHLSPDETPEQALEREVWEEARVRVVRSTYIGCQRID